VFCHDMTGSLELYVINADGTGFDNRPVLLTLLNMAEIQVDCFVSAQSTRQQYRQECTITFFLQSVAIGSCHRLCDCSAVSQFPSRTPIFLTPFYPSDPGGQVRA